MRIGIIGGGCMMERANLELSVEETVFYTVRDSLGNAGLERKDIDTIVQAADDVLDGIAINHVYQVEAAGSFLKDESKVERDGAWGAMYAMAKLLTGKFQTAMVVAYSKASQIGNSAFSGMNADPFYLRPVGVDADSMAGLQAAFYVQGSGATETDFAEVAAQNRRSGAQNTRTMHGEGMDIDSAAVLASDPIAEPVRDLSRARAGDGCVVLFLANEEYIRSRSLKASYIKGVGFASDAYYPTYRKLDKLESAEIAIRKAERSASMKASEVDFAELHECYAHQQLMLYEALGLSEPGKAISDARDGAFTRDGRLPVNVSGGAMCSNVPYAAGLMRMYEAHLQLTGQGEAVQLDRARTALVHSQGGLAMQSNIAFFLEGAK